MESFPQDFRAIVIGASGGIGHALAENLAQDPACSKVWRLHRASTPAIDLEDEQSIATAAETLADEGPFQLIIDATGVLERDGAFPEKALRQVTAQSLNRAFALNATGPALLIKHFHRLLPTRERGVLATLSARVGSIGDNHLGGWFGYRASKAALNMLLRTAAIEVARRRSQAVCLALHPGTVRTALSERFVGHRSTFGPEESARLLLDVIDESTPRDNGAFLAYDSTPIVW
jgi:NAD(P)-dependent dehydrogenase (short-subunit alcohol dehydrogenase family)